MVKALPVLAAAPAAQPTGAAFDIVLMLHVLCAVVGFATVTVSGVQASRLGRVGAPGGATESLRRYYAPGPNWAGRALVGVPVFGFALLAMSHGAFSLSDRWVLWGLTIWVVAVGIAEGLLWPAEQRVGALLRGAGAEGDGTAGGLGMGDALPAGAGEGVPVGGGDAGSAGGAAPWAEGCRHVVLWAVSVNLLLVVASGIMITRPG